MTRPTTGLHIQTIKELLRVIIIVRGSVDYVIAGNEFGCDGNYGDIDQSCEVC